VFGARRDAQSWAIKHAEASSGLLTSALTLRGYTGHEQLDEVGLVHMGGRVYDPILGRFLQADPFIQQPNNTQNLNRYSYVLNNPLNATDPSGYFFQMLVMWAAQYIAAATAGSAIGTALGAALTAYQYYGYAQMAVGAIRAIEGGGTAMANFAGGMAKGFAKGQAFNCITGAGRCLLAGESGSKNTGDVDGQQGTTSTDNNLQLSGDLNINISGGETEGVTQSELSSDEYNARVKLAEKIKIVAPGLSPESRNHFISEYREHVVAFALTDEGAAMLSNYKGDEIRVQLSNQGSTVVRNGGVYINVTARDFAKASGDNVFVRLSGMRAISHELVHVLRNHVDTFDSNLRFSQEVEAMRVTNTIIKQHHIRMGNPALAGERVSYQPRSAIPRDAVIKK